MSLWSNIKSSISSVGSHLSDFGDYAANVVKNPSIYSVIPGSKGTGVGNFIDELGQASPYYQIGTGVQSLWNSLTGKTAEEQYEQSREDAWNQFNQQMDYARHSYQYMAQDMAAAGMNPLASLGASPASGPSGGVASPTASATGGLGAIASFISPILGAVVSRQNNMQDNATREAIAKEQANIGNKNADTNAKNADTNAKNAETQASVGAATVQEKQENTRGKKLENDYSERTGITSLTPTASASVRDAVDIATSVQKANERLSFPFSKENLGKNEQLFQDVIGSSNGRNGSHNFTWNYLAWIASSRRSGISFEEYLASKFPREFNAYVSSKGNGHE